MSRFPICTCQSGMCEFAWQIALSGGPQLGGYTIRRCPVCEKCSYHLPAYGLFFIPEEGTADEETLRWLYAMEAELCVARREAGTNPVVAAIKGVPTTITLYIQRDQSWEIVRDCLGMQIPANVRHVKAQKLFALFFLHPPAICRSVFDD